MKKIIKLVVPILACVVLIAGIVHASIHTANHPDNIRSNIVTVGDLARDGREMITREQFDYIEPENRWAVVVVSEDHLERISNRNMDRRELRAMQLEIDNWPRLDADATPEERAQRQRNIERARARLAVERAYFRAWSNQINLGSLTIFASIYLTPFALLAIASAVLLIKSKKDDASKQENA